MTRCWTAYIVYHPDYGYLSTMAGNTIHWTASYEAVWHWPEISVNRVRQIIPHPEKIVLLDPIDCFMEDA